MSTSLATTFRIRSTWAALLHLKSTTPPGLRRLSNFHGISPSMHLKISNHVLFSFSPRKKIGHPRVYHSAHIYVDDYDGTIVTSLQLRSLQEFQIPTNLKKYIKVHPRFKIIREARSQCKASQNHVSYWWWVRDLFWAPFSGTFRQANSAWSGSDEVLWEAWSVRVPGITWHTQPAHSKLHNQMRYLNRRTLQHFFHSVFVFSPF